MYDVKLVHGTSVRVKEVKQKKKKINKCIGFCKPNSSG